LFEKNKVDTKPRPTHLALFTFFKKIMQRTCCLPDRNLATIAVVEKSGHKFFSLKNSFSTHFYLKTPNKHLYNIKKPIYQPKQLYKKKGSKNTKSNQVRIFFLDLDLFLDNFETQNNFH
jgi:hypothetical protein